jgi:hypothetical protein
MSWRVTRTSSDIDRHALKSWSANDLRRRDRVKPRARDVSPAGPPPLRDRLWTSRAPAAGARWPGSVHLKSWDVDGQKRTPRLAHDEAVAAWRTDPYRKSRLHSCFLPLGPPTSGDARTAAMTYQRADRLRVGDRARQAPVGDGMTRDGFGSSADRGLAVDGEESPAGAVDPDSTRTEDPPLGGMRDKSVSGNQP